MILRSARGQSASATFTAFLEQLLAGLPSAPVVAVICDNVIIHRSKIVQRRLRTQPRLRVLHGARYSPHDNPIERIWDALKTHLANSPTLTIQGRIRQVHAFCGSSPAWSATSPRAQYLCGGPHRRGRAGGGRRWSRSRTDSPRPPMVASSHRTGPPHGMYRRWGGPLAHCTARGTGVPPQTCPQRLTKRSGQNSRWNVSSTWGCVGVEMSRETTCPPAPWN